MRIMKLMFRLLVVFASGSPIPAFAQAVPPVELSFGYSYLARPDAILVEALQDNPFSPFYRGGHTAPGGGWFVEGVGNVTRHIGLVGHASATYTPGALDSLWRRGDNTAYTVLAGPRFTSRCCRRVVPFAQTLVGFVHSSADFKPGPIQVGNLQMIATYRNTFAAFSAGGGVDVRLAGSVGVRFGVDMMRTSRTHYGSDFDRTWRIRTGLIVPMR